MLVKIGKPLTENVLLYLLFLLLSNDCLLSIVSINTWTAAYFFGKKLHDTKILRNHFFLTFLLFSSFGTSIYIVHAYGKNISPRIDRTEFTSNFIYVSVLLFLVAASISTFFFWRAQENKKNLPVNPVEK